MRIWAEPTGPDLRTFSVSLAVNGCVFESWEDNEAKRRLSSVFLKLIAR